MEESRKSTNVKALTALFAEKTEPIMGVKPQTKNLIKPYDSKLNPGKKTLPCGEKPPIKARKPVLPKTQPRKPPRTSISSDAGQRSSDSVRLINECDSPVVFLDNVENSINIQSPLDSSASNSQSHESLNTVFTNDSGISSNPRLDAIVYKAMAVNNEMYHSGSCSDLQNFSESKYICKLGKNNNSIRKELEEKIDSDPHLKSSSESSIASNNNLNESHKYPLYRRVILSSLHLSQNPPRKPMLPPDVHIALVRPVEPDSPPPAPPRRLSHKLDGPIKLKNHLNDPVLPGLRHKQRRNTAPSIEVKLPTTSYSRPLRIVPSRPSPPPPVLPKFSLPNSSTTVSNSEEIYSEADETNSIIPEYTEEEEQNDCAIYDEAESSIENPPPLPSKPLPSSRSPFSTPVSHLPGTNNGRVESHYQSPVVHILPSSHERELPADNRESRVTRKEQKEKEKKEREIAKAKKKYSLTGNERALNFGYIRESVRGKRSDLTVKKGERVIILRMENNPSGMWLVQNVNGKVGYAELTNIEVDPESVKCIMRSHSAGNLIDGNSYDEDSYDVIDDGGTDDNEAIYEETC